MSRAALTLKYRPQTFADVAGQETVKVILSRAAQSNQVAPAYLFSGTRGVGKTTLARVFAKALNCRQAPAAEPCNQCDMCRGITQGSAVDVVEIDGASNRGIDDVRRLKEVVGYAPMEGRYKIFIIDEAHMLSREAFNALLKTLEEPPAGVTFIMATTEAHKFPATIISRCQHFVFKRLSEQALATHLEKVLNAESVSFDSNAVRLIARRGAGSVRDSMSLLGQVLALGDDSLTEEVTRSILGLAGHGAFFALLQTIRQGDCVALCTLLGEMLDQGLDMGFFLREFVSLWRNLFILRQNGHGALAVVDLPEDEALALLEQAEQFSLSHIHACWQMTLEGQRRVLTSLEPASALELLLLNLAMLPQLLSLEGISALSRKLPSPVEGGGSGQVGSPPAAGIPPSGGTATSIQGRSTSASRSAMPQGVTAPSTGIVRQEVPHQIDQTPSMQPASVIATGLEPVQPEVEAVEQEPVAEEEGISLPVEALQAEADFTRAPESVMADAPIEVTASGASHSPATTGQVEKSAEVLSQGEQARQVSDELCSRPSWDEVVAKAHAIEAPPWFFTLAADICATWEEDVLHLTPQNIFTGERLQDTTVRTILEQVFSALCGSVPPLVIAQAVQTVTDRSLLRQKIYDDPLVQHVEAALGGKIVDYGVLR